MTWLTWRQFRPQAWTAVAALAIIAITLAATRLRLTHLYNSSGFATCHTGCATLASNFVQEVKASTAYSILYFLGIGVLYVAPAVIGIFWGAPLVTREVEAGTFKLAWNQSVTRARWLAVKLGLIGLAAMATAGLLSLVITWWVSPIDRAAGLAAGRNGAIGIDRLSPVLFGARGITPVGYAAFAFALGVTVGMLIRRTIPSMAITLAVFAAIQFVMPNWIRPYLIPPVHAATALNVANIDQLSIGQGGQMKVTGAVNLPGAWILSNQSVTPAGHVFTGPATPACLSPTGSSQACQASIARLHLRQVMTYQPASRYWAFQWYETAIFLALALALAGFCAWWIRRRSLALPTRFP